MSKEKVSIAIIGAGVAGLRAADLLINKYKFQNVRIYEAKDRIGGRTHTIEFGDGAVEEGAQFIHARKSPLYDIAKKNGFLNQDDVNKHKDHDEELILEGGTIAAENLLASLWDDVHEKIYDRLVRQKKKRGLVSFADEAKQLFKEWKAKHEKEFPAFDMDAFWTLLEAVINIDYAAEDWTSVGVQGELNWKDYPREEYIPINQKGYSGIVNIIAEGIEKEKIFLNSPVTGIAWRTGDEKVHLSFGKEDEVPLLFDHVIVTVPLGYLKQNHVKLFTPPLPTEKKIAIESTGFGSVEKVFVEFSSCFWNREVVGHLFCWMPIKPLAFQSLSLPEKLARGFVLSATVTGPEKVLLLWVAGASVHLLHQANEQELKTAVELVIAKFYPNVEPSARQPINIAQSGWGLDPYTLGSYAHQSVENDKTGMGSEHLIEPLFRSIDTQDPAVLFAGEATHPNCWSTVHGAYWTGEREAQRLNKFYSKIPPFLSFKK